MKNLAATLNRYSKFIAAIIGAITEAVNLGYVPHVAQNYVSMAVTILTALGVVGVSNGPALADGTAIANDVAAINEQLAPLKKLHGWQNAVAWLHSNGKQVVSIVEAAKTDVEDLIHQKVSADKPKTSGTPIAFTMVGSDPTAREAIANIGQAAATLSEAPTPVAEPASQSQMDAVAELATLVP